MALKTVFSFFDIRWPLSSRDARDVNSVSGGRVNAVEMGNKSGTNGSISEMLFHHTELALSVAFSPVKLNSLALYRLEFALMCLISINVSDNTRVLEIYDSIVDEKSGSGRRVENVEIVIFDPRAVEVGRGMCTCMKGNGVFGVSPFANPYDVSINPNLSEGDISCNLILTILVEEDQRVLPRITMVILAPPISWMIWVVKLLSELGNVGDGTRCGGEGDSGVIHSKSDRFVTLYIVI